VWYAGCVVEGSPADPVFVRGTCALVGSGGSMASEVPFLVLMFFHGAGLRGGCGVLQGEVVSD